MTPGRTYAVGSLARGLDDAVLTTIDGHFDIRVVAAAAIKAMRDPAFDMVEAGQAVNNLSPNAETTNEFEFLSRDEMTEAWQAMIDAALK